MGTTSTVHRGCNLCEASCGLVVEVQGREVLSIRGDADDPLSRGYVCPKGIALQDLLTDPDRLRSPVKRLDDGSFVQIGWDEALDLVADGLVRVRDQHGGDAVSFYLGNPITHGWAPVILVPMLMDALRVKARYSAASVDQQPQHLLSYLLFGSPLLLPVPDLDRTDHLLVIGGNPAVSNGSIMTAPDMRRRIRDLQERGGRCVVVDPRRSETADLADEHVAVRPGTDVWLLAAMLTTLDEEGLVRPGAATSYVDGLDRVLALVRPVTAERAAAVTGIDARTIRRLARELASARRAAVYARLGVTQSVFGTPAYWLVHALNIATGRLDAVGGWMFSTPAFDLPVIGQRTTDLVGYDRWRSRVRGIPEFSAELPLATLADEILEPGEGRLRALVLYAGNPVLSSPDGRRLEEALRSLDFCVAVDYYVTESSRHAHVILPPVTPLERDEFDVVFPAVSVRNWVRWSPAAVAPEPGSMSDADILMALLDRVWRRTESTRRTASARIGTLRRMLPRRAVDVALRAGPWGVRSYRRLSLKEVERAEHGVDLGPLRPGQLPKRLLTKGRRVDLAHPVVVADWPRVMAALEELEASLAQGVADGRDLLMVGRRHLRSNNSWMHNSERLTRGRARFTVQMHPDDAASRGLADGDIASVATDVGAIDAPVEVTDRMMRGVVSVPHGWGHDRGGAPTGWRRAASLGGASVNDITDSTRIDPLSGNAGVQAVPVSITRADPSGPA